MQTCLCAKDGGLAPEIDSMNWSHRISPDVPEMQMCSMNIYENENLYWALLEQERNTVNAQAPTPACTAFVVAPLLAKDYAAACA